MKTIEKRDYIHNHLYLAEDRIIDDFYEILRRTETVMANRKYGVEKMERDIHSEKMFSRTEIEERALLVSHE